VRKYSIILIALLLVTGCKYESHKLTAQVLRSNGTLNVFAKSDVQGSISSVAGNNPNVTIKHGDENIVVIEQTQITIRGEVWGEIPENIKNVRINFSKNKFKIELD